MCEFGRRRSLLAGLLLAAGCARAIEADATAYVSNCMYKDSSKSEEQCRAEFFRPSDRQRVDEDRVRANQAMVAEAQHRRKMSEPELGELKQAESMGSRFLVLEQLRVPVIEHEHQGVFSVHLDFVAGEEGGGVLVSIVPFYTMDGDWNYLRCHHVGLRSSRPFAPELAAKKGSDGWWLHLESRHDGQVSSRGARDRVLFDVSPEMLARLSEDPEAMIQICNDQLVLSEEQRAQLAEFVEKLDEFRAPAPSVDPFGQGNPEVSPGEATPAEATPADANH